MIINLSICIIILTNALVLTSAVEKTPIGTALVLVNHGVVLRPKGLLGINTNTQLISVFRKVKIPQIDKQTNCDESWIHTFNAEIMKSTYDYIDLFNNIAAPHESPSPQKRQALLALGIGLGITDLLLTGLSHLSLSYHMSKIEGKLNDFINQQHSFDEKSLKIDTDIVELVTSLESNVNNNLKDLQCQILLTTGRLFANQLKNEWIQELKALLEPIMHGRITSPLTPDMLTPSELTSIIKDHKSLKDNYFSKNVYNLYKAATLSVINVNIDTTQTAIVIHQILQFPVLKPELLVPYYKVLQNTLRHNTSCYTLKLPNYVYIKKGDMHTINDLNCKIMHDQISTCSLPPPKATSINSCLNNLENCTLQEVTCLDAKYIYDM